MNHFFHGVNVTVQGAGHIRNQKPCQDASGRATLRTPYGCAEVLVVADGHGGTPYFRSAFGSRTAVNIAIHELSTFFQKHPTYQEGMEDDANNTKAAIYHEWEKAVLADFDANPLTQSEQKIISGELRSHPPIHRYGTTLHALLIANDYTLVVSVGDGSIFIMNPNGDVERPYFDPQALRSNLTYSLCQGLQYFEHMVISKPVAAAMVCTDGLTNAFSSSILESYFRFVYGQVLRDECKATEDVEAYLNVVSQESSDDDVSLAFMLDTAYTPDWQDEMSTPGEADESQPSQENAADDAPVNDAQADRATSNPSADDAPANEATRNVPDLLPPAPADQATTSPSADDAPADEATDSAPDLLPPAPADQYASVPTSPADFPSEQAVTEAEPSPQKPTEEAVVNALRQRTSNGQSLTQDVVKKTARDLLALADELGDALTAWVNDNAETDVVIGENSVRRAMDAYVLEYPAALLKLDWERRNS